MSDERQRSRDDDAEDQPISGDWLQHRQLVLNTLKRLERVTSIQADGMIEVRLALTRLETKIAVWGVIIGFLASFLTTILTKVIAPVLGK